MNKSWTKRFDLIIYNIIFLYVYLSKNIFILTKALLVFEINLNEQVWNFSTPLDLIHLATIVDGLDVANVCGLKKGQKYIREQVNAYMLGWELRPYIKEDCQHNTNTIGD